MPGSGEMQWDGGTRRVRGWERRGRQVVPPERRSSAAATHPRMRTRPHRLTSRGPRVLSPSFLLPSHAGTDPTVGLPRAALRDSRPSNPQGRRESGFSVTIDLRRFFELRCVGSARGDLSFSLRLVLEDETGTDYGVSLFEHSWRVTRAELDTAERYGDTDRMLLERRRTHECLLVDQILGELIRSRTKVVRRGMSLARVPLPRTR